MGIWPVEAFPLISKASFLEEVEEEGNKGSRLTQVTWKLLLHPFNDLFSRTAWVCWHQKGKPFWILLEQEMMWWQWHQLDHMQIICTSRHNHASASPLSFYRPDALPATQPTALKHWRSLENVCKNTWLLVVYFTDWKSILSPNQLCTRTHQEMR